MLRERPFDYIGDVADTTNTPNPEPAFNDPALQQVAAWATEQAQREAARALGVSGPRIMLRHILPNVLQPVVVLMAVGVGSAILSEAALSFLGVGVKPPNPSLGLMVSDAQSFLTSAPYMFLFPGLAIVLTVLGFLLVGDGLRDALDVKDN